MNPIGALIIANIIWGAAAPIFKYALTDIPPFTLAFIRFFFAGLIFVPFAIRSWRKITSRELLEICIGAFFGISINISFFFIGLQYATSINAPIISSASPVFLFLLSVLFLKEKPKLKVITGMAFSFLGVLILIFSPLIFDGKQIDFGEVKGNILFVIAAIGAVLHPLVYKNILKKVSIYQITMIGFLFSSLTFSPFMFGELRSWWFDQLHFAGWIGIIFGVLFSSALAYFLFEYGLKKIKVQEIGLFTYIDPVIAILIAIPLLGEYPNSLFVVGSLFIFGGIYLAENRIHWHPIHKIKYQK